MLFSNAQRVIYKHNPIVKVIYQLRFPTILSINTTEPATYQDKIREVFPLYRVLNQPQTVIKLNIPPIVQSQKNHCFLSENEKWQVNLTSSFISFSTEEYNCWEDFKRKFQNCLTAFLDIYKPAFFERIGLRYIDAFNKSQLGLNDELWKNLINPAYLGILSESDIQEKNVQVNTLNSEFQLDDELSNVKITAGLGHKDNSPETGFLIDCDCFCNSKLKSQEIYDKTEYLHTKSTTLIRGAITSKLHEAMEPRNI